jgi:hypothetical protein
VRHSNVTLRHSNVTVRHSKVTVRHSNVTVRHSNVTVRHSNVTVRHRDATIRAPSFCHLSSTKIKVLMTPRHHFVVVMIFNGKTVFKLSSIIEGASEKVYNFLQQFHES